MRHPLCCSLAALAGLLLTPAWAEPRPPAPDSPSPLTLQDALQRAQAHNPRLASFPLQLQAAAARVEAAALRPAPELSISSENLGASGKGGRLSETDTTVTLAQVLEPRAQRQRRVDAAAAAQPVATLARTEAEQAVAAETRRRFVHLVADQQRLEVAALAIRLADRTVAAVRRRVDAGRVPAVEQVRARMARSRADIAHEHAEHELLSARRRLAAMWGAAEPDFGVATANLLQLPQTPDLATMRAALDANPELRRLAAEGRQREAEVRAAEAGAQVPLTLRGGIKRREAPDDLSLVVGLSMPLFGARQAAPGIAEARALHDQIPLETAARRVELETRLFERLQELRHAITEASALRDDLLPQMDRVLADTEQAWREGRYSLLEWTSVQAQRLQLERDLIDAASEAHGYHIDIEQLIGRALTPADHEEPTP